MGKKRLVPDRWHEYCKVGKVIPGTLFIPFKVPLENYSGPGKFQVNDLVEMVPNLGLVIDFTKTTRYYEPSKIKERGILYFKLSLEGHGTLPSQADFETFADKVDTYSRFAEEGKLIGVHCTHGLNRTGYFICKYLILKKDITPPEAVDMFEKSRGHQFDRYEYVVDLYKLRGLTPPPKQVAICGLEERLRRLSLKET